MKYENHVKKYFSGSELPVKGFTSDSSGVRFGHFYWIIGGYTPSSGTLTPFWGWSVDVQIGQENKNSYLWSIKKRKWINGPEYPHSTNYTFKHTCALTLNASSVLFVGLLRMDLAPVYLYDMYQYPNSYTAIYNFESKKWIEQDTLFTTLDEDIYFSFNTACTIEQNKREKRSVKVNLFFLINCMAQ